MDLARVVRMNPIKPRKPRRLRAPIEPGLANEEEDDPRSACVARTPASRPKRRRRAQRQQHGAERNEGNAREDRQAIRRFRA